MRSDEIDGLGQDEEPQRTSEESGEEEAVERDTERPERIETPVKGGTAMRPETIVTATVEPMNLSRSMRLTARWSLGLSSTDARPRR